MLIIRMQLEKEPHMLSCSKSVTNMFHRFSVISENMIINFSTWFYSFILEQG